MSSDQPNEASIFNAARKIAAGDARAAYLSEACHADLALKQRVEQLLEAHAEDSQFLEQAALEVDALGDRPGDHDPGPSLLHRQAHPAPAEQTTSIGGNHSILNNLANTINFSRVTLREPESAGRDPIERPNSPEIPAGDAGSRYRLDGEIARGGIGAIIKGRDTKLGRDLAIKVLLDVHKDKPEVIQRFIEEAQIGGQLQHPGIAPVYELGQFADQRPFFSMKLVKGETLARHLADRGRAADDRGKLLGIFEQVCQTMAYAHSRGVIHRDLKPANIMVGAFGEVQVMDWGLAKVLPAGGVADEKKSRVLQQGQSIIQTLRSIGSDTPAAFGSTGSHTEMGSVMGTPAYMPPEQALGEIDNLDERADVFGLGAILCEILTGVPPYAAEDGTQIFRLASRGKLEACMARLDDCGADAELIALTKQCLELEPADRPRDAGVLAERVTGYLESVEAKLRETELQRAAERARAAEERKRRRISLALASCLLLVMIAGTGISAYFAIAASRNARETSSALVRVEQQKNRAEENASRAEENAKLAESRLRVAQRRAYSDQIARVGQSMQSNPSLALDWLEDEDACPPHLREFTWHYCYQSLKHESLELSGHEGLVTAVDYADNGELIASGSFDHTIRVWNPATGEEVCVLRGHEGPVTSVRFSPNSRVVASASHVKLLDIPRRREQYAEPH
ncbi:serine/threonine-protein kinase [Pirellulales bacterium]|nr:serine/threonine-protein kinase [Pirellulales bacterium]